MARPNKCMDAIRHEIEIMVTRDEYGFICGAIWMATYTEKISDKQRLLLLAELDEKTDTL